MKSNENEKKREKRFLTMKEISLEVGVSVPTIRKWDDQGVITSIKVPGTRRRLFDLEKVIAKLETMES